MSFPPIPLRSLDNKVKEELGNVLLLRDWQSFFSVSPDNGIGITYDALLRWSPLSVTTQKLDRPQNQACLQSLTIGPFCCSFPLLATMIRSIHIRCGVSFPALIRRHPCGNGESHNAFMDSPLRSLVCFVVAFHAESVLEPLRLPQSPSTGLRTPVGPRLSTCWAENGAENGTGPILAKWEGRPVHLGFTGRQTMASARPATRAGTHPFRPRPRRPSYPLSPGVKRPMRSHAAIFHRAGDQRVATAGVSSSILHGPVPPCRWRNSCS